MNGGKGNTNIVRAQHHQRCAATHGSEHFRLSRIWPPCKRIRFLAYRERDEGIEMSGVQCGDGELKRSDGMTSGIGSNNARCDHCFVCAGKDLHHVFTNEECRPVGARIECRMVNGLRQDHRVHSKSELHIVRTSQVQGLDEALETDAVAITGSNDDAHSVC